MSEVTFYMLYFLQVLILFVFSFVSLNLTGGRKTHRFTLARLLNVLYTVLLFESEWELYSPIYVLFRVFKWFYIQVFRWRFGLTKPTGFTHEKLISIKLWPFIMSHCL